MSRVIIDRGKCSASDLELIQRVNYLSVYVHISFSCTVNIVFDILSERGTDAPVLYVIPLLA